MEVKLRSTSRTIPWSLLVKAALFGVGWLVLPTGLFLALAIALYFLFPFFQPTRTLVPFLLLVFLATLPALRATGPTEGLPGGAGWGLLVLGGAFFLILGIKELALIRRELAFEVVASLLLFGYFLNFFASFDRFGEPYSLLASLALGGLFAWLLREIFRYAGAPPTEGSQGLLAWGTGGFLVWQWGLALTALPLNYFHQTALLLLFGATIAELLLAYATNRLTRRTALIYFSVFLALFSIILAGNSWVV
jgi:hypothetical protein